MGDPKAVRSDLCGDVTDIAKESFGDCYQQELVQISRPVVLVGDSAIPSIYTEFSPCT